MRRIVTLLALAAAGALAGCGGKFDLPTEHPSAAGPAKDSAYVWEATWGGMDSVTDVMMTSGSMGSKVMVLANWGAGATTGPETPRGAVRAFRTTVKLTELTGTAQFAPLLHLFNPIALSAGQNRLYVLDLGDSCMAKFDAARNACDADPRPINADTITYPRPHRNQIRNYAATWRVRVYPLEGGDTVTTVTSFTDTTVARVYGIAADDQGNVYVSALAVINEVNPSDPFHSERKFAPRIYRYAPGILNVGTTPPDNIMPGCDWHRDATWQVLDGAGGASVADARGIAYSRTAVPALFVADRSGNKAKLMSVSENGVGFASMDGDGNGVGFNLPSAVAVDPTGNLVVVDRGNRRVLHFNRDGLNGQVVNLDLNAVPMTLLDPIAVGVNDTLAYVGDRGTSQLLRFKRRQ